MTLICKKKIEILESKAYQMDSTKVAFRKPYEPLFVWLLDFENCISKWIL